MRLRIWIEDVPLSPDMEPTTYLDVDMRGEWSLPEARRLVLGFAQAAHESLGPSLPEPVELKPHPFISSQPPGPFCLLFVAPNTICGLRRDDPLHERREGANAG